MALYKTLVHKVSIPSDKKTKQKDYQIQGMLPIIDQGQKLIGGYSDILQKTLACSLPVIVFGDHSRNVKYITFPFGAGADGIKVLEPKESVLPKYLFYGTEYLVLRLKDRGYARHYQFIEKMDIPVPAIPEQERIVARIEELFSQLVASVSGLKTVKEQLKVYRQAVLKEAFGICSERTALSSLCKHITDGDHMPPPKAKFGIPFIMISNVTQNKIDWTNTAFVCRDYYNNIDEKRRPQNGDVLYTVTGSFGIPILVDFNKEFCFQRHIALLRPNNSILQKYLYYALQEPSVFSQASKMATGTAQKTVSLTVLRKMTIPYTESISAQQEVVSKIENQLSVCDSIEKTVDTTLQQAEALRQSILKKAFEGRL